MQVELSEEFYKKVHQEAVAFRHKKLNEVLGKMERGERVEDHELMTIKLWQERYNLNF